MRHALECAASPTGLPWSTGFGPGVCHWQTRSSLYRSINENAPPKGSAFSLVGEEGLEPSRLLVI